jgi:ribonuclease Z
MAVITHEAWSVPGPTRQLPPEKGRRPVFSDFTNSGFWQPAYEAQNEAMDKHMEKYNLQDEDWRPGMFKLMEQNQ